MHFSYFVIIYRGDMYIEHTKCISEAERYGGKDYVAKPNVNKGERKQQEWICVVSNLLNNAMDLSNEEKNFLNTLSRYENIPRKKTKFINFIRNALGNRINARVVESVWNKMEIAHKKNQESVTPISKQDTVQTQEQNNGKYIYMFNIIYLFNILIYLIIIKIKEELKYELVFL